MEIWILQPSFICKERETIKSHSEFEVEHRTVVNLFSDVKIRHFPVEFFSSNMTQKRTPTLMFELNSSYSNVQKTKKKTAAQNSYFGWDNWRKVRAGCISQDTYLLYTRNQMKINYLDARTTTLVLNVGMFKWPCWALQCDFQLHSFYLQLWSLSRGGHSSFPPVYCQRDCAITKLHTVSSLKEAATH